MNGNVLSPAAEEASSSLVMGSADLLLTASLVPIYLSLSQGRAESGVDSYEHWNDRHQKLEVDTFEYKERDLFYAIRFQNKRQQYF